MASSDPTASNQTGDAVSAQDESIVTPWEAGTNINYSKLIDKFGSKPITPELIERMEKLTGHKAHPWLRRGLFFSHRDFEMILDLYEKKEPFYLYTGRGPSSDSLHLGHLVPFQFTQWLQKVFNCILVIQLTDDEKHYWKKIPLADVSRLGFENAKDIIACGFDVRKTFIFRNTDYIQHLYPTIVRFSTCCTFNSVRSTFGFDPSDHVGKVAFPPIQAAPSFSAAFPHIFSRKDEGVQPSSSSNNTIQSPSLPGWQLLTKVPCLIPCAIDQDPYFRLTRDVAHSMGYLKPALIHSRFFPALQGSRSKMSASSATSAIYVTDTKEVIAEKIKVHAFSGGRETIEEHRRLGGNCDEDVPYQYLTFFLDDDDKLEEIRRKFSSGEMSSSEIKRELVKVIVPLVERFQASRARVTDDMVRTFMSVRDMTDMFKS